MAVTDHKRNNESIAGNTNHYRLTDGPALLTLLATDKGRHPSLKRREVGVAGHGVRGQAVGGSVRPRRQLLVKTLLAQGNHAGVLCQAVRGGEVVVVARIKPGIY